MRSPSLIQKTATQYLYRRGAKMWRSCAGMPGACGTSISASSLRQDQTADDDRRRLRAKLQHVFSREHQHPPGKLCLQGGEVCLVELIGVDELRRIAQERVVAKHLPSPANVLQRKDDDVGVATGDPLIGARVRPDEMLDLHGAHGELNHETRDERCRRECIRAPASD